jgi:hypothetical protein
MHEPRLAGPHQDGRPGTLVRPLNDRAMLESLTVHAGELSDEDFLRTLAASEARVLLIGRRAMIILGAPVMTADYDVWLHIEDIEKLNHAFEPLDLVSNRTPDDARKTGRYVLENGERIDVIVARSAPTPEGQVLDFESAWSRRQGVSPLPDVTVFLPSLADLITTKRWGSRPKDMIDIQYLEVLRTRRTP